MHIIYILKRTHTSKHNTGHPCHLFIFIGILSCAYFGLFGCTSSDIKSPPAKKQRTTQETALNRLTKLPTVKRVTPWQLPDGVTKQSNVALAITTDHYQIYTTVTDPLILEFIPVFLESSFIAYCKTIQRKVKLESRFPIYLFQTRLEWADFTKLSTGHLSKIYLQITAGAYFDNGICVAWHLGRTNDYSVLAHEGWHQFAHRVMKFNLPSWLNEGIATTFEKYRWQHGNLIFEPKRNGPRLFSLKNAIATNTLLPLETLVATDPGNVLLHTQKSHSSNTESAIGTYYGQCHALIRFLQEYNQGAILVKFIEMLQGADQGTWPLSPSLISESTEKDKPLSRYWNSQVGAIIFDTYISKESVRINSAYRNFCLSLASTVSGRR